MDAGVGKNTIIMFTSRELHNTVLFSHHIENSKKEAQISSHIVKERQGSDSGCPWDLVINQGGNSSDLMGVIEECGALTWSMFHHTYSTPQRKLQIKLADWLQA